MRQHNFVRLFWLHADHVRRAIESDHLFNAKMRFGSVQCRRAEINAGVCTRTSKIIAAAADTHHPAVDTGAAAVAAQGRSRAAPATAARPEAAVRRPAAHRDCRPCQCSPATFSHGHPGQRARATGADDAARAPADERRRASASAAGLAPCAACGGGLRGA